MNKQGKGKIEWTDWTWNPVRGLCPVGCSYCYARGMYKHYGWDSSIRLDEDELVRPMVKVKPLKIFVCSTFEIFHPAADEHRDVIFDVIKSCPRHIFQILTKMPENIDRPMPDNVFLGVSITGENMDFNKWPTLCEAKVKLKFISFEPILSPLWMITDFKTEMPSWVIMGRLTGHGKAHNPSRDDIVEMTRYFQKHRVRVFQKHNLNELMGHPLIQEMP